MLFSVLTRQGKVPRHNVYSPRSQSWLTGGRSQLAAPSGPDSHIWPSCHPWRRQASNPTDPQSLQATQMGRPSLTDCDSDRRPLLVTHRDRHGGEAHHSSRPGPWLVEGHSEGSGAPSLFPEPSSSPTGPRLCKLEGLQKKAWFCLLAHFPPDDHHTTDTWLNNFPNGPSLIVISGQGWPIAGKLTVAHWQLVASGQGPMRHQAMVEQDLLPSNGEQSNEAQQWLPAKSCAHPALLQYDGMFLFHWLTCCYPAFPTNLLKKLSFFHCIFLISLS